MNEENSSENKYMQREERRAERKTTFRTYFDMALLCFLVLAAAILFFFLLQKISVIGGAIGSIIHILSPVFVGFALAYVLDPVVAGFERLYMNLVASAKDKKHKEEKAELKKVKKEKGREAQKKLKARNEEEKSHELIKKQLEVEDDKNPVLIEGRKSARWVSVVITVLLTITCLILLLMAVIPALIDSVAKLAQMLPSYAENVTDFANRFINKHAWIKKQIPDVNEIFRKFDIYRKLEGMLNTFLSKAADWVIIAFKIVYNILIGLIIAIYLLLDKERYVGQAKKIIFAVLKPIHAKHFVHNMHGTHIIFKKSILGKILDSIIIGFICFIAMSVCQLLGMNAIGENKALVSIVVGVTNVIPFFGPFFGGIPSVFIVLCEKPIEGVVLAVIILVLQQFDSNYLTPMIVGKNVGLSPFYVLVAILLGGGLFGVIGMLLAVPAGAVIYGIIKSTIETRLEEKKLPVRTNEYAVIPGSIIYENMEEQTEGDSSLRSE